MMNRVELIGRLTRDIEKRYTGGNDPLCIGTFTLAVDRGKSEGTDFIRCKVFGKRAETMSDYIGKGRLVGIEGHIQTGSYEKDGKKVYTTDVVVDEFTFCDSKKSETKKHEYEGFTEYKEDEDVPF